MADRDDGDNLFSDNGLDDLPLNALEELEHNAIQFTQNDVHGKAAPSSDYGDFDEDDFDDAVVIDETRGAPAAFQAGHRNATPSRHPPSSNHSLANRPREIPLPSLFHQANSEYKLVPVQENESMDARQGSYPAADINVENLQRQLQELLEERNTLKQDLNAKAGEISIVRSKNEKIVKEHERELTAIRKLNADILAKQQKALEAAKIAEKNAAVERDFIKRDLQEQAQRTQRLNKAKEAGKKVVSGVTTPKRPNRPYRDGFDDDEIELISPSKLTPSKFQKRSPAKPGAKRKRKAIESPAGALDVVQAEEARPESTQQNPTLPQETIERLRRQDDRFDYTPIYLLLDLLTFALELKTLLISPHIIDSLLPVVQSTGDLVAIPRWKGRSADPYDKDINVLSCLNILHLVALGCIPEEEDISRFWKLMRLDFVLMMLSTNHPPAHYEMMLRILSTSVLRNSFGAITPDETQQSLQVSYIIDRLAYPLLEPPPRPKDPNRRDVEDLAKEVEKDSFIELRLPILQLLSGMTRSPYAGSALARHPAAIGKIISLVSDELDILYDYKEGRETSLATRLLYHLVMQYDQVIDMQKKVSIIQGGHQKYLLCLSRLNFSEDDLLLEAGIDPDVAGWALEMLELAVTPEEGDAIHSAFSTV
ncbi:hypothetical protein B7494_g3214 [Chlorociboria aeruginascens]|nr:hypothetical protein B7494_g3214 [Chlorociboria aeruginascens]